MIFLIKPVDISISINGSRLNARVGVLLKTCSGYLFERDRSGYLFPVGGRIKINEDSESAAKREVREEVGLDLDQLTLIGVIENFFRIEGEPFHEFCFLYKAEVDREVVLPVGFHCIPAEQLADHDLRPTVLYEFVHSDFSGITHRVARDNEA